MSYYYSIPLVVETELAEARAALGGDLVRILGYFQEDGARSIGQIEQAMAAENAAALVIPAHTLKGEARQLGARRLGDLAEVIETTARRCLEQHCAPSDVASEIAMLRACFVETLSALGLAAPASPAPRPHAAPVSFVPQTVRPTSFTPGPRTFGRRVG